MQLKSTFSSLLLNPIYLLIEDTAVQNTILLSREKKYGNERKAVCSLTRCEVLRGQSPRTHLRNVTKGSAISFLYYFKWECQSTTYLLDGVTVVGTQAL